MQAIRTINIYRVRFTHFWEEMDAWQNFIKAIFFASLIILGAKINIFTPFTPIPFTLQTFFIMSLSLYLREKYTLISTGIYLLLGLIGVAVFAGNGAGYTYFVGATGGYLISFLLVPPIISRVFHRYNRTWKSAFLSCITGSILILSIGSLYLGIYLGDVSRGFVLGFLPFIGVEIIKAIGSATSAKILLVGKS